MTSIAASNLLALACTSIIDSSCRRLQKRLATGLAVGILQPAPGITITLHVEHAAAAALDRVAPKHPAHSEAPANSPPAEG